MPGPTGPRQLQRAVVGHAHTGEEVDSRGEVAVAQVVAGRGEREQVTGVRCRAVDATVAVARLVGPAVGVPAQRVVAAAGVVDDRHEHATEVGQQGGTGTQVGLPLHLHRVGGVEPLARLVGVEHLQVQAGVARQVRDAEHRAPGQAPLDVAPRADRLVPDDVGGRDPVRQLPRGRRRDRHAWLGRAPAGSGHGSGPARACSWRTAPHPRLTSLPPIRTQPAAWAGSVSMDYRNQGAG